MICEFSNWWLCGVGSWKRAGNSAFEFSSTKRKLCRRRRPTTWTTKASEMRQPDWISIRWVSRVCANVCALGNERLPHGLDVRLSFQFPLSLIEQRLRGWRKEEGEGIATNRGGFFFPSSSCLTFPLDIHLVLVPSFFRSAVAYDEETCNGILMRHSICMYR